MALDLALSSDERAVSDSVARFCVQTFGSDYRTRRLARFSRQAWESLGALGILELSPFDGGAQLIVAALRELGAAGAPGPIAAAYLAGQVLADAEREGVTAGTLVVALGVAPNFAFGADGDLFIGVDGEALSRVQAAARAPYETLAYEPWARVDVVGSTAIPSDAATRGLVAYDLAVAALTIGAARTLLDTALDHARERRQFGRPIGSFQAVAFPLARRNADLEAAVLITRAAASKLDAGDPEGAALAPAARLFAARCAREIAFVTHQTLAAFGATEEGPVSWLSRRIQQFSAAAPDDRAAARRMSLDVVDMLALSPVKDLA